KYNRDRTSPLYVHAFPSDALKLMGGPPDFFVRSARCEVVAQHTFPVRFLTVVERVPRPILDHVRTGGSVRIHIEPQLTVVRWILTLGIPANGLGVCLGNQLIRVLQGTHVIAYAR